MTVGELKSILANMEDSKLVKVYDVDDFNDPALSLVDATYVQDEPSLIIIMAV